MILSFCNSHFSFFWLPVSDKSDPFILRMVKDEKVLLNEAKTIHNSVIAANDQLKIDVV